VDAVTAQTGGSAFETAGVKPEASATWLKFGESSLTLQAGRQKAVDFTVAVPRSVKPGQYLAGISAYVPNASPGTTRRASGQLGANVTMQMRYVIAVQVDVEGAWTPALQIESASLVEHPSGPFIGVLMKNDGDTFLKPSGAVVLTDRVGTRVLDQPITLGTFVPGTQITFPVKWNGELKPGDYEIAIEMKYAENETAYYNNHIKMEAAHRVEVQPPPRTGEQPGTFGAPDPPGSTSLDTSSASDGSPTNTSFAATWLVALLGGLTLAGLLVLAVAVLRARQRQSPS
jgi:hypothetical protein